MIVETEPGSENLEYCGMEKIVIKRRFLEKLCLEWRNSSYPALKGTVRKFFPSWKHFVEPLKSPLGYELAGQGMLTPRFGTPTAGSNFDSAYQVSMYEEHLARIGARQGWLRQLRFRKWL